MHCYGETSAFHYAAYRPPLHRKILELGFGELQFEQGLDFGCGTGQSTLALTEYADTVIGMDSSQDMLAWATPHPRVTYVHGSEHHIPMVDRMFDVVAFAGVVPYLNQAELHRELVRVTDVNATLLSYDFKISLDPVLDLFWPEGLQSSVAYDHGMTLQSDLGFKLLEGAEGHLEFQVTADEAAHLLLANEARFQELSNRLQDTQDVFEFVVKTISDSGYDGSLDARIFWARYGLIHSH